MIPLILGWLMLKAMASCIWLAPAYWRMSWKKRPMSRPPQRVDGLGSLPERVRDLD